MGFRSRKMVYLYCRCDCNTDLGNANPRRCWSDLKIKLSKEGSELHENIVRLKVPVSGGKNCKTDVADAE